MFVPLSWILRIRCSDARPQPGWTNEFVPNSRTVQIYRSSLKIWYRCDVLPPNKIKTQPSYPISPLLGSTRRKVLGNRRLYPLSRHLSSSSVFGQDTPWHNLSVVLLSLHAQALPSTIRRRRVFALLHWELVGAIWYQSGWCLQPGSRAWRDGRVKGRKLRKGYSCAPFFAFPDTFHNLLHPTFDLSSFRC